jgi:hypothetical protein
MTYSPNSVSQYEIGSQTLVAGGPAITVSGAIVSLAPSASALVIGSNTQALSPSPVTSIPQAPGITLSPNLVLSTDPAATYYYIIGSQTLVPGGPPLTLSGTRVSLAASASALIIGSMTSILPIAAGSDPFPLLTIDSHTLTASSAGHTYAIGSQSLIPGGPAIVVSGMTLSLDPAGTALIVDGTSTQALASTIPSSMVIGSHTLIANAAGQYIFGIQTLVPGGPGITIDGTVISILASATTSMATTSTTTEAGALDDVGLAMLILKGLGGTASPTKSPHTETSSSTMSIQSPRVGNNGNSSTTESSGKPSGASLSRPGVSLTLGAAILSFIVVLM